MDSIQQRVDAATLQYAPDAGVRRHGGDGGRAAHRAALARRSRIPTRYVDDFVELAAAVRGERKLPITPEEDLVVQKTLLRASGMEG